jgi:NTP pyrophosphohydrolases including oxidative damage repair enzymes
MIQLEEVAEVVDRYLARFPEERDRLVPLMSALEHGTAITDRANSEGHLTCSAILLDPKGRVLHIRHNVLGTWLRPGGHVEPHDTSLPQAALRELFEETGIPASVVNAVDDTTPLDIDAHTIPANPVTGDPEHRHFDLHYAYTVTSPPTLTLQVEEVNAYQWIPATEIVPMVIRRKVMSMIPSEQHGRM